MPGEARTFASGGQTDKPHFAPEIWLALAFFLAAGPAQADVKLAAGPGQVDIANDFQKVSFVRDQAGRFLLTSFVRVADAWQPLLDGQLAIIQGTSFDLHPTAYEVKENSASRLAVCFTGRHENPCPPEKPHLALWPRRTAHLGRTMAGKVGKFGG